MSKDDSKKPTEVLEAERSGGETFDPTEAKSAEFNCPDCNGDGIRSADATQVCSTCEGTGKV